MENKKLELINEIIDMLKTLNIKIWDFGCVLIKAKELKQILLEEDGDKTWLFKFPNGNKYEIEIDYNMGVGGGIVLNAFCFKILKDGKIVGQDFDLNKAISMVFDMENKSLEEDTYKNASENMEV